MAGRRWWAFWILTVFSTAWAEDSPLDRYVHQPDDVFGWTIVRSTSDDGLTTHFVELTSQRWQSEKQVDRSVWKHLLVVVVPAEVTSKTGFLYIGGGSHEDPPLKKASERIVSFVKATGTIGAELYHVPNQPIRFVDSPEQARSEDDLVAYSRVKFFETGDPTSLVRLAMVKSAVRAMDAVIAISASDAGGMHPLDSFVVAGGSKRGWTTWLTAAVDSRVVAIVPFVIDALNSQAITRHHYQAYGFFSPALQDYVDHKIFPHKIGTPEYGRVLAIEDPYGYRQRDRLGIPKLLVNATGDQFFLPDNWQFYYREMPGEKHLYYVPNAKHDLADSDGAAVALAFYQMVLAGRTRPSYDWTKGEDGSLEVRCETAPTEVNLWQATNAQARDFRVDAIGKAFTKSTLAPSAEGVYRAAVPPPTSGYTAFFVEMTFPSGGSYPLKVTTGVSVVPDVLPFDWKNALKQYAP